ncbi:unnamed protein product [Diamesa serratosioi]
MAKKEVKVAVKSISSVNDFTSVALKFSRVNGWMPYKLASENLGIFKLAFFWVSQINIGLSLIQGMSYFVMNLRDPTKIMEITNLGPCMGMVMLAMMKMYMVIYRNQDKITTLMDKLDTLYPKTLEDQEKYGVKKVLDQLNFIMVGFSIMYMSLLGIFNVMPIYNAIYYYYVDDVVYYKELPFIMWYPFDPLQPIVFELCYFSSTWSSFTTALSVISTDLLYCSILTLLCMEFDILKRNFEEMLVKDSKKSFEEMKKLVSVHIDLINCSTKMEDIFSVSLLINFIGSTMIICLVGFQTAAGIKTTDFIKFCLFLLTSLIQILLLCYYGEKLIESSGGVADGIYNANWTEGTPEFRKSIRLIILRAHKPQTLTTLKFSKVSLSSFTTILNTSYSYYTLLSTIYLGWKPYTIKSSKSNEKVSFSTTFYFRISMIYAGVCMLQQLIYLALHFGDGNAFLELTNVAPCMGFSLLALVKIFFVIYRNKSELTNVMAKMDSLFPKNSRDQERYGVRNVLKHLKLVMRSFSTLYMGLIWLFNLMPIFISIYLYFDEGIIYHKQLPYIMWYPFDPLQPIVFEVSYIVVMWGAFTCALSILSTDLLYCSVLTLLCLLFDILKMDLQQLNSKNRKITNKGLKRLIIVHNDLIGISRQLEKIFSVSILINFVGSSIILCLVGFQASAGVKTSELIKFCIFLLSSMVQILLLCWYGNKLIESSVGVADGVYNGDWYEGDENIKKSLKLIIIRAQKPQYLTAFKFSKVSLSSFSVVLSSSYSYFTLLRTIYEPRA